MNRVVRDLLLVTAQSYAEACADQEDARVRADDSPEASEHWRACCLRSIKLQSALMRIAKATTDRVTDPPEFRPGGSMYREIAA